VTLEKAIEILELDLAQNAYKPGCDLKTATQLLIEAGKRLVFNRLDTIASSNELLPGETKE